jgi:hypothetical protein
MRERQRRTHVKGGERYFQAKATIVEGRESADVTVEKTLDGFCY